MNIENISDSLLAMVDKESGGDNALNGFEFQISSAIYLIFEQFRENKDFSLLYEKLEDFIIINDKINLYQAKGVNFSITPLQLIKNRSDFKKNESILEKMYDNYLQVKNEIDNIDVETCLIICDTQIFSSKLWDTSENYDKDIKEIVFEELGVTKKSEMLDATRHESYDWKNIKARRLIPKPYHEEVTRCFIEDVINEKFGESKINSWALYGALTNEIKRIRKKKQSLTKDYLSTNLNSFVYLSKNIKFSDFQNFLPSEIQNNIAIKRFFDDFKITYTIPNHPVKNDYDLLSELNNKQSFITFNEFQNEVEKNTNCKNLCIRLSKLEMQALILLVIATE